MNMKTIISNTLQRDRDYVNSCLNNTCKDLFQKIYATTNEDLLILFDKLNINGKDVLTVLSSSDYLYMSYLNKARNVDGFDINPLTERYYYLRKWLINNGVIDIKEKTLKP